MTYQNINKWYQNRVQYGGGFIPKISTSLRTDLVNVMDLSSVNAAFTGFQGCCTDGRYVYLNPANGAANGYAVRYDTSADFTTSGSYESVDINAIDLDYESFLYSCFDGRYVYYFSWYSTNSTTHTGFVLRYDTHASFASGNFTAVDLTTADATLTGLGGGIATKDSIFTIATYNSGAHTGKFLKYDYTDSFTAGNFSSFDLSTIDSAYKGFVDMTYDGRYVYLVPYENNSGKHGNVIRYDTTLSFSSSSSYEILNLASLNSSYIGFAGATFDGRYIYFCPRQNVAGKHGYLAIYDTTKEFSTNNIEVVDLAAVDSDYCGYMHICFDGSYVYLSPYENNTNRHGNIVKVDINTRDVEAVDTTSINAAYCGYRGCVSVGDSAYFVPFSNTSATHGNFIRVRTTI